MRAFRSNKDIMSSLTVAAIRRALWANVGADPESKMNEVNTKGATNRATNLLKADLRLLILQLPGIPMSLLETSKVPSTLKIIPTRS